MTRIQLQVLELSAERLRRLSPRDRYVFALVGHIFNELMCLLKLTQATRPPPGSHEFQMWAGVGQATTLLRLLLGKTHEALETLRRHSIDRHLRAHYFTEPRLLEPWEAALERFERLDWLRDLRNRHAFHYMSPGQWGVALGEEFCEGAKVIVGRRFGDTFFHWSDTVSSYPMLARVNPQDPIEGLGTILEESGELLISLTSALAMGVQRYMRDALTDADALGEAVAMEAPRLSEFHIPYFYGANDDPPGTDT